MFLPQKLVSTTLCFFPLDQFSNLWIDVLSLSLTAFYFPVETLNLLASILSSEA